MAQQRTNAVQNNFTKGLLTEFTGLNFPENAATDTDNCVYSLIGDVSRREGIDFEDNFFTHSIDRNNKALSTYRWNNVGGDGITQILVNQVGSNLYFYKVSSATVVAPLSTQYMSSIISVTPFIATGTIVDPSLLECQYTDGNGYLFVFHPNCDPFYCSYDPSTSLITANPIAVKIRDFNGITEPGVDITNRPLALTNPHLYNLKNQGWTSSQAWGTESTTLNNVSVGIVKGFAVTAGLPITIGDTVNIYTRDANIGAYLPTVAPVMYGTVSSYSGTSLLINILAQNALVPTGINGSNWSIYPVNFSYVGDWHTAIGNYPSNADVWWNYKNNADVFAPGTTIANVTQNSGYSPKGHYILNAFNQQKSLISGVSGLNDVSTVIRPKTGTWFQGRVWYTGVDASQSATGNANFFTWTESIYFSQIVVDNTQFGLCYQSNDPTSESLFDILPTDGGVITIQGAGSIYKLFPMQNGMLVFAANGVWFITGSQGIGFSATDYTITKISKTQSISSTSFVDVQGLPMFWNEEGIYQVTADNRGNLSIDPITVTTILSFYNDIPTSSKKYVRGDYHPIDYIVQWSYRSTEETNINTRYEFDKIMNYNVHNQAFFPYTILGTPHIHGVNYVAGPGGSNSPIPAFKYLTSYVVGGTYNVTFSEEHDDGFLDWKSFDNIGSNYDSYFVTGYSIKGQAQNLFQPEYVYMYSRNDTDTAYKIQGIWNYATSGNSGKYSSVQLINNSKMYFDKLYRRHRIRGHGTVLQLKIMSVDATPFNIMGWSISETVNAGN